VAINEVKERFPTLAVDPRSSAPSEFARLVANDIQRFGRIAREANIKAE